MSTNIERLNAIVHSLNDLQHADRTWMESDQAQCISTLILAVADLAQIVGEQQEQIEQMEEWSVERYNRAMRREE